MTLPLKLGKQSVNCQGTAFIAIIGTKSVELKLRKYQRGSGSICPSSFLKKHSKKSILRTVCRQLDLQWSTNSGTCVYCVYVVVQLGPNPFCQITLATPVQESY